MKLYKHSHFCSIQYVHFYLPVHLWCRKFVNVHFWWSVSAAGKKHEKSFRNNYSKSPVLRESGVTVAVTHRFFF